MKGAWEAGMEGEREGEREGKREMGKRGKRGRMVRVRLQCRRQRCRRCRNFQSVYGWHYQVGTHFVDTSSTSLVGWGGEGRHWRRLYPSIPGTTVTREGEGGGLRLRLRLRPRPCHLPRHREGQRRKAAAAVVAAVAAAAAAVVSWVLDRGTCWEIFLWNRGYLLPH